MKIMLDSFWRAIAYCIHPKVILLSLLPLILMAVIVMGLGAMYWDLAVNQVRMWMDATSVMGWASTWLERMGLLNLKAVLAPLFIIFAVTPLVMIMALVAVSFMITPALVGLVSDRRFPNLARKQGGSLLQSMGWTLLSVFISLLAFVVTLPLWWIPFMAFLLPPLIWGWLTYRVMAFDALATHASEEERHTIFKEHRLRLLGMGIFTGFLGAAPTLVWASGVVFAAAFVILVPVAIWVYTLVFAFSSLWFTHYALSALQQLRARGEAPAGSSPAAPASPAAPDPTLPSSY
jgi:MFS family permease